jgi:hypothetical protein
MDSVCEGIADSQYKVSIFFSLNFYAEYKLIPDSVRSYFSALPMMIVLRTLQSIFNHE